METGKPPQLLTTDEVAERWRMSGRTLERWRSERYGPRYVRLGGTIRYRLDEIEAYESRHLRPGG
jgi:predicted DNA-binding transcriptional regulator AlpA